MFAKFSSKINPVLVLSSFLIVSGCQADLSEDAQKEVVITAEVLVANLFGSLQPNQTATNLRNVNFPDGTLGYVSFVLKEPGKKSSKLAVMPDGLILSRTDASRIYKSMYRSSWGNLAFEMAKKIEDSKAAGSTLPSQRVMVWYRGEPNALRTEAERLNATQIEVKNNPDVMWLDIEPSSALILAKRPDVRLATTSVSPALVLYSNPPTLGEMAQDYVNTDVAYPGKHAVGVKVGLIEANLSGTKITHPSVAYPGRAIVYKDPNTSAGNIADHGTEVASRIGALIPRPSPQAPQHQLASKSTLYVYNETGLDETTYIDAMQWMAGEGVFIVNESWGGGNSTGPNNFDFIRDWFVRYENIKSVKAAGNNSFGEADCKALNSICVGSTHSNGSYSNFFDDYMDQTNQLGSSYLNPSNTDIERPDVVSEGDSVWVARGGVPGLPIDEWKKANGTSVSTPVISGLLALHEQDCNKTFPPHQAKSMLRNASYTGQGLETASQDPLVYPSISYTPPFYPTPGFILSGGILHDSRAGAGITEAERLKGFCSKNSGNGVFYGSATGTIDPQNDPGDAPLGYLGGASMDSSRVLKTNDPLVSQSLKHDTGSGYKHKRILSLSQVNPGSRVRASLVFYTCPGELVPDAATGGGAGALAPATDFDLVLCSDIAQECFALSESEFDTNEGFDIKIDQSYDDLHLHIVWANGAQGCSDSSNNGTSEPWAISATWWPN